MSARRRPPKVKEGAKEVAGKDIAPVVKKAEGIILDGTADEVRSRRNNNSMSYNSFLLTRRKKR